MEASTRTMPSATGQTLKIYEWIPENPRAILQILHGMGEHMERYDAFAKFLNTQGYAVVGGNHAGHGETCTLKGYFADSEGWDKVLQDIHSIRLATSKKYPLLPYFIFGHSMGSFLLRSYLQEHSQGLTAAIICATGEQPAPLVAFGTLIAKLQCFLGGAKKPCKILADISNSNFTKALPNSKTSFDWLTRDDAIVQKYIADEYCGFPFTANAYLDLFSGFRRNAKGENYQNSNKTLPLLFIAGDQDPVGDMGKMVEFVANRFGEWGFQNIEIKLYPGARHEILNETNMEEVFADVLAYLERNAYAGF